MSDISGAISGAAVVKWILPMLWESSVVYLDFGNILNVLGKQRNEMLAVRLVKTYCIPMLLYGCEVWSVRPADMRSVDVAWNNSFHKIFIACWWEIVCLPRYLFISVESSSMLAKNVQ